MNYLEGIIESIRVPTSDEQEKLYSMAGERNPVIRRTVAKALMKRHDVPESEKILRKMTYDTNRTVRMEAVYWLFTGRTKETLSRLKELMETSISLRIRTYAITSYFSVWVNMYGYHKKSMKDYLDDVGEFYKNEKDTMPLVSYERNRYMAGEIDALKQMQKVLLGEMPGDIREQYYALECLCGVRKVSNIDQIDEILEVAFSKVCDKHGLAYVIGEMMEKQPIWPMVLILDRSGAKLSQLLEYLSLEVEECDMQAYAFGVSPSEEIDGRLVELIQRENGCDIRMEQYPRKIEGLEDYDFIVPIGMRLEPEEYPFQIIVPLFENVDENMLDLDKAREMVIELNNYIYRVIDNLDWCPNAKKVKSGNV
ncbi:HEAT repeat domain-containing protein [Hominisplanchenecus murintestinalis]|uniref:HEAT repeat domain-containing protein n=2 Tax=Hominisplanchenecus murintestinalis TaxID=2941517 RepID=A0AC61QVK9_9FIRM|nr:HEAT repeat domain-containing protein [Hominisplanchenecus murintestinalis]